MQMKQRSHGRDAPQLRVAALMTGIKQRAREAMEVSKWLGDPSRMRLAIFDGQAEVRMDHPTIWKFIDGIRAVQKGRDLVYEQLVRADQPPIKRRKYTSMQISESGQLWRVATKEIS